MSEYKTAAFNAKKKGDIELAKKYLRLAKVCFVEIVRNSFLVQWLAVLLVSEKMSKLLVFTTHPSMGEGYLHVFVF